MSHVSLEQAKKLKEAGYPQENAETYYSFPRVVVHQENGEDIEAIMQSVLEWQLEKTDEIQLVPKRFVQWGRGNYYAAPSEIELMEWLKKDDGFELASGKSDHVWIVSLPKKWPQIADEAVTFVSKNLIDALFSCTLWLLEQKKVKV